MSILIDQQILELCDEFVPGDPPEYFFDKNPENFSAILELHRSLKMRSFYIVLTSTVAHIFSGTGFFTSQRMAALLSCRFLEIDVDDT